MKKTIITGALALAAFGGGLGLSSCGDFLEITPLNGVVVENYWEKKSEVESVITACYYEMQNADFSRRVIAWGEMRGDNTGETSDLMNEKNLELYNFFTNNITPDNSWTSWSAFYNVINLCNTVLYYAPQTQARDGNYTMDELHTHEAEVKAIRALCYFYLIRSFEKVPLVTTATIGDDESFQVAASSEDVVLDFIVSELEWAQQYIWNRNYFSADREKQKGRFNKQSVRALLADVCLWRGDYARCAELCQGIIDEKLADYATLQADMAAGNLTQYMYEGDVTLYNGYPLLNASSSDAGSMDYPYFMIFYTGNSFESIFELQYDYEDRSAGNEGVTFFYGNHDGNLKMGLLSAATYLTNQGANDLFSNGNDTRLVAATGYDGSTTLDSYPICKIRTYPIESSGGGVGIVVRSTAENWIIYRLTDIMLMQAEALAYMGGDENCQKAFDLVQAVNLRACQGVSRLQYDEDEIKNLVLDERQRELLYEGKRWYDLVRMVRHADNPTQMMSTLRSRLQRKYTSGGADAVARIGSLHNLFLPFCQTEIDVNPLLEADQNPAYSIY